MRMIENFFQRENTLTFLDKIVRNEVAVVAGFILFGAALQFGWWEWLEPLITLVGIPFAGASFYEYWRRKTRRYAPSNQTEKVIVAVSVNQDVGASILKHFGRQADVLIDSRKEMGGAKFLSPDQCHELAKIVLSQCLPHRDKIIYLVLAGPAGLCFQIGQLLGAHKFRIVPLSWAGDQYQEIPMMGIDDMCL